MPAKVRIRAVMKRATVTWIPAFAGMTVLVGVV